MTIGTRGEDRQARTPLVVCVVDQSGRLSEISANAAQSIGWGAGHRETSLHEWVHPEDVHRLMGLLATSTANSTAASASVRIRAGNSEWLTVQCLVSPLVARDPTQYAVAIRVPYEGNESPDERAARFEGHLWRIALEVQAADLGGRRGLHEDWWAEPGLGGLSERQAEILRRIVRGERVPDIARELVVTESTVRNHLSGIYRKFGVHSQSALMLRLMPRASDDSPDAQA